MIKLTLRRIYLAIIILLTVAWLAEASQSDGWIKLEPLGGGFSASMPGRPDEEVNSSDDLTMHLFTLTTSDAIYLVGYGDYAPSLHIDVDEQLAANRDSFAKRLNVKVLDTRKITVEGHKGIEFIAESDQAWIKSRIFLFGTRVHQIAVATPTGRRDSEDAKRFLASFAFAKADAPAKQRPL